MHTTANKMAILLTMLLTVSASRATSLLELSLVRKGERVALLLQGAERSPEMIRETLGHLGRLGPEQAVLVKVLAGVGVKDLLHALELLDQSGLKNVIVRSYEDPSAPSEMSFRITDVRRPEPVKALSPKVINELKKLDNLIDEAAPKPRRPKQ